MKELIIKHKGKTNIFNILNINVPKEDIDLFLKNAYKQSLKFGPDFRPFPNLQQDYKIKLQYMESTENYKIDCNILNWTLVYDFIRRASLNYNLIQDNKANLSSDSDYIKNLKNSIPSGQASPL